MTYGITARENDWSNVNITANILTDVRNTGVQSFLNETANTINITSNTITTTGSVAKGILISERGTAVQGRQLHIETNIITTTNGGSGIECSNVNHARLLYNSITQDESSSNTNAQYGIKLNGNETTQLNCNSVTRNNSSTAVNFGYHINISTSNNLVCNTANNNDLGIYFGGDCDVFNSVAGNTMTNCATGLLLNSAARIGTQLHKGNKWINTQGGSTKAENLNTVNNNFLNSEIVYNPNSGTVYAPTIIIPPQWFSPDVTGITYNGCATQVCNTAIAGVGSGDEEQLKNVARDSAISYDYLAENRNQAQQNLYAVLYQDSLLRVSDSVFANFFGNHQSEAIGQLHLVGKNMAFETVYDSLFKHTINQADSLIGIKADSLLLTTNASQRQWLINGIRLLQDSIQALLSQKQVAAVSMNEIASSINEAIVVNEIPENNLKAINGMKLLCNKYDTDTLLHFYSTIESIAQQCPYSGGKAVFQARVLLCLFNDSIMYNDATVCLQSGIYRNLMQQDETATLSFFDFSLLPNPASQQVQVAFNFTIEKPMQFEIRNVLGGKVSEFEIDKGLKSIVFTTQNYEDGIYFIRMRSNGLSLMTKKLIIIKNETHGFSFCLAVDNGNGFCSGI
ncbi:MAG: T9SS type A sorting domain-containing protein [Bacteroidia bacterium]|nr:T9SS type A sorting domain-containing protein [Bacteroidia bacterium]